MRRSRVRRQRNWVCALVRPTCRMAVNVLTQWRDPSRLKPKYWTAIEEKCKCQVCGFLEPDRQFTCAYQDKDDIAEVMHELSRRRNAYTCMAHRKALKLEPIDKRLKSWKNWK